MPDYQPLDLTPICNANRDVYGSIADPPLGSQAFYGLPFQIGDGTGETDCFIGFVSEVGCPAEPVAIPVGQCRGQRGFCPRRDPFGDRGGWPHRPSRGHVPVRMGRRKIRVCNDP